MLDPAKPSVVEMPKVVCSGDKESPHPRVFLAITDQGFVDCPYCGQHFVLTKGNPSDAPH
ncbi:MAG: zinc-finger domain-containing protein [Alphaproteobacteria bacterium]|nr:zinc-finger domain-containing protein [Alphaproteobacteria bacterium]